MWYIRKYWHVVLGVVCIAILGTVYFGNNFSNAPSSPPAAMGERTPLLESAPTTPNLTPIVADTLYIQVHIEGEVRNPGVYSIAYGSRVNDLLILAGGATEDAFLRGINLAAFLSDAQQIIIPSTSEESYYYYYSAVVAQNASASANSSSGIIDGRVNINVATESQLTTLPGVGPAIAGNIIAHRELNGPFSSVEELRNVNRIGEVTMDRLRDLVTVG